MYLAAAVLALVLLAIDVVRPSDWAVDDTTLGLLAVLLVVPLLEQLRKIKVGSVELELQDVQEQLARVRQELASASSELAESAADAVLVQSSVEQEAAPGEIDLIERIVWVDDDPENNRPYVDELRQSFDVELATSTEQGVALVSRAPERTLLVTDAVRVEGDRPNYDAGLELIRKVREEHPQVPVLVFAGYKTVTQYSAALDKAGARVVTNTFVVLAKEVRRIAARRLQEAVRRRLADAGWAVDEQAAGVDFVAEQDGQRIGIELKHWRRPPIGAVGGECVKLERLISEGKAERGILVLPVDVRSLDEAHQAPPGVSVVALGGLEAALSS
jgi:CheY-like chemotaxis protein